MTKIHNITFEEWEAERLRDPKFRAACEALEAEYQADRLRILEGLGQLGVDEDFIYTCHRCGERMFEATKGLHKCDPIELDKLGDS